MSATDEERFPDFVHAHSGTLFRSAYLMTGDLCLACRATVRR